MSTSGDLIHMNTLFVAFFFNYFPDLKFTSWMFMAWLIWLFHWQDPDFTFFDSREFFLASDSSCLQKRDDASQPQCVAVAESFDMFGYVWMYR